MIKKCIKCGVEKELGEFCTECNVCKICREEYNKEYRKNHKKQIKEYAKEYHKNHKEQIKERGEEYYKNNKEQRKEYDKEYGKNHKKEYLKKYNKNHKKQKKEYDKEYSKNHKERKKEHGKEYYKNHKKQSKEYYKNKYATDIQYRLATILRGRLRRALKNNQKSGSAVKDLGCSIAELKIKLEQMFYPNPKTGEMMTWENQGSGWHIDHIIPLSSFDLTDRVQLLKACHYLNLQPLWAKENLTKGRK